MGGRRLAVSIAAGALMLAAIASIGVAQAGQDPPLIAVLFVTSAPAPGGKGIYLVDDAGGGPAANSLRLLH
jgi:hypothetical protein